MSIDRSATVALLAVSICGILGCGETDSAAIEKLNSKLNGAAEIQMYDADDLEGKRPKILDLDVNRLLSDDEARLLTDFFDERKLSTLYVNGFSSAKEILQTESLFPECDLVLADCIISNQEDGTVSVSESKRELVAISRTSISQSEFTWFIGLFRGSKIRLSIVKAGDISLDGELEIHSQEK